MAVASPEAIPAGVTPTLAEARALAGEYNLIPLREAFIDDCETPVSAFLELRDANATRGGRGSSFLLDFGPTEWREDLPYPEDAALIGMDRLRFVDGVPAAIHRSVIDETVADSVGLTRSAATTPGFSLYRLFDRSGLTVERGVETLRARAATADEARLLNIAEAPVVMAVRRETFGPDGILLDVVNAVYDARRYSYQAEIRRDHAPTTSNSHSRKIMEANHASNSNVERAFGPRLGPWSDRDGGSG
jgi:GntR family transcriptional regulator